MESLNSLQISRFSLIADGGSSALSGSADVGMLAPSRPFDRRPRSRAPGGVASRAERARPLGRGVDRLREALNETTYATWFGAAEAGEFDDETFTSARPNDFTREWIEGHFLGFVQAAARDALGRDVRVVLTVGTLATEPAPGGGQRSRPARGRRARWRGRTRSTRSTSSSSARRTGSRTPRRSPSRRRRRRPTTRCSSTAARGSARPTCSRRSAHYVRSTRARLTRRYVTSETFMNDFINSLRDKRIEGFKRRYRALRRPAHRRHPVLRGQGADPGGVLPHLQRAVRGRPADRHLLRPAAAARSRRSRSACARGSNGG